MLNKFLRSYVITVGFGYCLSLTILSLFLLTHKSHAGGPGTDWAAVARNAMSKPMAPASGDSVVGYVGTEAPSEFQRLTALMYGTTTAAVVKDEIMNVYVECQGDRDFGRQRLQYKIDPKNPYDKDDVLFFVYRDLHDQIRAKPLNTRYRIQAFEKDTLTLSIFGKRVKTRGMPHSRFEEVE